MAAETPEEDLKQAEFLKLYEPIHARFAAYCHARLGNRTDADDLVSETVLIAFEKFGTLRQSEAFLSFLFGIAANLIKNKHRRRKFWGLFKEKESVKIEDPSLTAEAAADVTILYQALNQLPETHREAVILFEISGFSLKEIQEIQQVSLSAVKARLVRGRTKLAHILKDPETDIQVRKDNEPPENTQSEITKSSPLTILS